MKSNLYSWPAVLFMVLAASVPALAEAFADGLHGMKWASSITAHPRLIKVHEAGPASYYADGDTVYQVSETLVDNVIYGFYQGKLFAGFIDLASPLQFVNLKRHFTSRYGQPKVSRGETGDLTVYRWKTGAVNIKLKHRESWQEIKLAIYFVPLSKKLNEERIENFPRLKSSLDTNGSGETPAVRPLLSP